ncbi:MULTISPECIES: hypothetical protein [unclassified Haladaptatus]|uniref:DUF7127 family protein n=1 Tax=unclassified Haladaptatus TaxID=2622732 RepID=UPI0023E7A352|nr:MULTISPECIES: hypothetical protein [unclassified Haladaptatus]
MKISLHDSPSGDEGAFTRYDYAGTTVFAADLGMRGNASVDLVDHTAIVVWDDDEQLEFEIPVEGAARAFIKNGVLTIEVDR